MKSLHLEPYVGKLLVAESKSEYEKKHLSVFREADPLCSDQVGRFSVGNDRNGNLTYLIWAKNRNSLVHELSHVVLDVFEITGIDPRGCGGEPFCYMLCSLLARVTK